MVALRPATDLPPVMWINKTATMWVPSQCLGTPDKI